MTQNKDIAALVERLQKVQRVRSASAVLNWDRETIMPADGIHRRAESIAELDTIAHQRFVALNDDGLIDRLYEQEQTGKLSEEERALVREVKHDFDYATKLTAEFVEEFSELTARAHGIWASARKNKSFAEFEPALGQIIDLLHQKVDMLGYEGHQYNALLAEFEPDMTTAQVTELFSDLQSFLTPLIQKITNSDSYTTTPRLPQTTFNRAEQFELATRLAQHIGYDMTRGYISESTHPFSSSFSPHDSRFTVRYKDDDVIDLIKTTLHETGHALYEQGLSNDWWGTPLGEARSYGLHESQSRIWEQNFGCSRAFWKPLYPMVQELFPVLSDMSPDDWYRTINRVEPSHIRVEADEVTYNLHIIIRYEIEKALMDKSIRVADVPAVWNEKMKNYLGVDVTHDAEGCLQDVHWSMGAFGYFPTYCLGNMYAGMWHAQIEKEIDVAGQLEKGQTADILSWLGDKVHRHGRYYSARDLAVAICGEEITTAPLKAYLEKKYTDLYL